MLHPQENTPCSLSETQREVLLQLLTEPTIEQHFFFTGGTARAGFYVSHRVSNDRDLTRYSGAQAKDAIFDDPPTVAFQVGYMIG